MKNSSIPLGSIGLIAFSTAALAGIALADGPQPPAPAAATAPVPAPAMPADLARQVQGITDAVLENHIDPPARQQMILSGIKALYRAAGVPAPPSLGRRISAIATPEQIAALLTEVWPRTTARPSSAAKLERTLLEGLLAPVPGRAELMTVKERNAAEQIAGNRYVGILVALGRDEKEQRPTFVQIMEGGPAARAEIKKDSVLEEVNGVDTRGMELREVVERLRGDEGTDVNIKVREPKEAKSRTIKLTRRRIASDRLMNPTVEGIRKDASGDWNVRLDVPDPIGYAKITGIGASTPHETPQAGESDGERWYPGAGARPSRHGLQRDRDGDALGRPGGRQPAGAGYDRAGPRRPVARRPTRPTPTPCSAAGRSRCWSTTTRRARRSGSRRRCRITTGLSSSVRPAGVPIRRDPSAACRWKTTGRGPSSMRPP